MKRFVEGTDRGQSTLLAGIASRFQNPTAIPTLHACLMIKYERLQLLPPVGKQKHHPPLELTVIHAQDRGKPKNRKPIDWKLITDLPVRSLKKAIEKLQWYALRWKIKVLHKILKSGCKAADSKLCGAAPQFDGHFLHRQLAHLLASRSASSA